MAQNRRNFIKKSLWSLTSISAWASGIFGGAKANASSAEGADDQNSNEIGSRNNPADCLILGAGIAGAAAAHRLTFSREVGKSPKKLLILEGNGRVGGRISTVVKDGFGGPIEQGAIHIHLPPYLQKGRYKLDQIKTNKGSPSSLRTESDPHYIKAIPVWHDLKSFGLKTEEVKRIRKSYVYFEGDSRDRIMTYAMDKISGFFSRIFSGSSKKAEEVASWWDRPAPTPEETVSSDLAKIDRLQEELAANSQGESFVMSALMHPSAYKTWPLLGKVSDHFENKQKDETVKQYLQKTLAFRPSHGYDMAHLALTGHLPALDSELSVNGLEADRLPEMLNEPSDFRVFSAGDGAEKAYGYDEIPKRLIAQVRGFWGRSQQAEKYDPLKLNHIVKKVELDGDLVKVTVNDLSKVGLSGLPTARERVFYGKTAICTFSVGLIKSGFVTFNPPLSPAKKEALEFVQIGGVTQIHLLFRERFWDKDVFIFSYPGSKRLAGRTYFNQYFNEDEDSPEKPPVLIAYLNGADDIKMKGLTDDEMKRRICQDLSKLFGRKLDPARDIKDMYRKQWIDDPFAIGGFSYLRYRENGGALFATTEPGKSVPVSIENAREVLADNEGLRLFWAGEALVPTDRSSEAPHLQPASVPGAHFTGIEAAKKVIEKLKS